MANHAEATLFLAELERTTAAAAAAQPNAPAQNPPPPSIDGDSHVDHQSDDDDEKDASSHAGAVAGPPIGEAFDDPFAFDIPETPVQSPVHSPSVADGASDSFDQLGGDLIHPVDAGIIGEDVDAFEFRTPVHASAAPSLKRHPSIIIPASSSSYISPSAAFDAAFATPAVNPAAAVSHTSRRPFKRDASAPKVFTWDEPTSTAVPQSSAAVIDAEQNLAIVKTRVVTPDVKRKVAHLNIEVSLHNKLNEVTRLYKKLVRSKEKLLSETSSSPDVVADDETEVDAAAAPSSSSGGQLLDQAVVSIQLVLDSASRQAKRRRTSSIDQEYSFTSIGDLNREYLRKKGEYWFTIVWSDGSTESQLVTRLFKEGINHPAVIEYLTAHPVSLSLRAQRAERRK
jgi:hypothetical protein